MNQTEIKQPFFVQFLESQKKEENNVQTTPSKDLLHTLKYPSDGDETYESAF